MVVSQNAQKTTVYYQMNTKNQSFIQMHYFLKQKGIMNNKFFLALYDSDLQNIDPRDPRLNRQMKIKVLKECQRNFWYFIREVVRIPDQGGAVGGGKMYELHRANLAMNFCFVMNFNQMVCIPRQFGKTISAICWYLWVYLFGTSNSEMMFMNKKHDDSKMNLARMKEIRDALPSYLQFKVAYGNDGKPLKVKNNVESMANIYNHNKVTTKPSARNKANANSLGRGCTMPIHWYDEYAFIPYNSIIYASATPAYSTASDNAKRNGAPYGILITTTPGDTTTDEGMDAKYGKETATPFYEEYYDYSYQKLQELKDSNTDSSFFYIEFSYKQLGRGEKYFQKMCVELKKDWPTIRREILLEWANMSDNSPFKKQDLDEVATLLKQPISKICLNKFYYMNIYSQVDLRRYPPIIGVDVSGGFQKDSSTITIIDSKTTEVIADFNCNYISTIDLAKVIYELVTKYMPNAIVNVERNGGFGSSVLSVLVKSKIKKNLYFEIKDRVIEERFDGIHAVKKSTKVKCYGYDETKENREKLMEILRERMEHHKAKFVSPIIYNELTTLEVKKNGRIEHSNTAHDDQIFSMLLALYVWYEGKNLMENFGLQKGTLYSDTDLDTEIELGLSEQYEDLTDAIDTTRDDSMVQSQLDYLKSDNTKLYSQWESEQRALDQKALKDLFRNKDALNAYCQQYHMDPEEVGSNNVFFVIPDSMFVSMMNDNDENEDADASYISTNYNSIMNQYRNMTGSM